MNELHRIDHAATQTPAHNIAKPHRYEGSSVVHFIVQALRLNRPALRDPVRYWAREHARATNEGLAGRDPFTRSYFRWLQNQ